MQQFERILAPVTIKGLTLKNRMIMAPMGTNFATKDGLVTERLKNYYEERAKGGVALIIVEAGCVFSPQGKMLVNQLGMNDDRHLPGLRELVQIVHHHEAKIVFQLHHAGLRAPREATGCQPVSASTIPVRTGEAPRALRLNEINEIIEAFSKAAKRAKDAGADAVEIHGAHGYLLLNFLSPYSNKRSDRYGGDLQGRTRFASDIVQSVRRSVGDAFPIFFRISADEYVDGGLALEETKLIARILENAGVDVFDVSSGNHDSSQAIIPPAEFPAGFRAKLAEGVKQTVSVPVIASGRINNPEVAEEILRKGQADLVSLGRALLADPEFPTKVVNGKISSIRRCIGCNQGCTGRMRELDWEGKSRMTCVLNPAVGYEKEYDLKRPKTRKRIMVVGGGPAGLEASFIAAARGHEVILFEEEYRLGGQLNLASIPDYKSEMKHITPYFENQLHEFGVPVRFGKEVKTELIDEIHPQVVILSTGALPMTVSIPGSSENNTVTAWEILKGREVVGRNVVVVGGGIVGCEVAEFLTERGKKVTIIEKLPDIARDLEPLRKGLLKQRLAQRDIEVIVNAEIERIDDNRVTLTEGREIIADTIVIAVGASHNKALEESLKNKRYAVYTLGDCDKPGNLLDAIHGAFHLARKL